MTKVNTNTKPPPSGDKPVKTEAPTTTGGGGAETTKEAQDEAGEKRLG